MDFTIDQWNQGWKIKYRNIFNTWWKKFVAAEQFIEIYKYMVAISRKWVWQQISINSVTLK